MATYITQNEMAAVFGYTFDDLDESDQAYIDYLIEYTRQRIEQEFIGQPFVLTTHTNMVFDGSGSGSKSLALWPIVADSATNLQNRTTVNSDWQDIDSDEYEVTTNGVLYYSNVITKGVQNWRITVQSGYTLTEGTNDVPHTIRQVGLEMGYLVGVESGRTSFTKNTIGVQSESMGTGSASNFNRSYVSMLDDWRRRLAPYSVLEA